MLAVLVTGATVLSFFLSFFLSFSLSFFLSFFIYLFIYLFIYPVTQNSPFSSLTINSHSHR